MALLAKLRPGGPWRVGPDSGDRLRVGRVLHSDALYSALTLAFLELGELDAWLEATALHAEGAQVRLSSCFPFTATENGDALFMPPPDSHWPPPDSLRIRWESARFVTPNAAWQLLSDKSLVEEHWVVDGVSECLLPVIRNVPAASPFRVTIRSRAAVDRMGQGVEPHQTACLEFSKGAGIWMVFTFASADAEARWSPALRGALKLIADSGLGGERSSGWGRFEQPEFAAGELGVLLFGNRYKAPEEVRGHWLLSLFSPASDDRIDWQQGNYRVVARTGRVQSAAGWGAPKRANQMIAEGGVLVAAAPPRGTARDVAPLGFAHPVYRAGFALTLPIGKAKPPKPVVDKNLLESLAKREPTVNDLLAQELAESPEVEGTPLGLEEQGEKHSSAPVAEPPAASEPHSDKAVEAEFQASPSENVAEPSATSEPVGQAVPATPTQETHAASQPGSERAAEPESQVSPAETVAEPSVTSEPVVQAEPAAPAGETHAASEPHPMKPAEAEEQPATTSEPAVEAAVPHSHAPAELPATHVEFGREPAAETSIDPEHTAPEHGHKKEAE